MRSRLSHHCCHSVGKPHCWTYCIPTVWIREVHVEVVSSRCGGNPWHPDGAWYNFRTFLVPQS